MSKLPQAPFFPMSVALKMAELCVAAPQVIAHRLTRMALAGAQPGARDRREFSGMVAEKQIAFATAWMAMWVEGLKQQQRLALSLMQGASPQQHAQRAGAALTRMTGAALDPVHRKAVANASRLSRTRLR